MVWELVHRKCDSSTDLGLVETANELTFVSLSKAFIHGGAPLHAFVFYANAAGGNNHTGFSADDNVATCTANVAMLVMLLWLT